MRIPDNLRGKRRTPLNRRFFNPRGTLYGWQKNAPVRDRYAALRRSVRAEGALTTKRRLIALSNVTKSEDTKSLERKDFNWLRRMYPPKK